MCPPSVGRLEVCLESDHVVATWLEALKGGVAGFVRAADLLIGEISIRALGAPAPRVVAHARAVVATQAISRCLEALGRDGRQDWTGKKASLALPQLFVRKQLEVERQPQPRFEHQRVRPLIEVARNPQVFVRVGDVSVLLIRKTERDSWRKLEVSRTKGVSIPAELIARVQLKRAEITAQPVDTPHRRVTRRSTKAQCVFERAVKPRRQRQVQCGVGVARYSARVDQIPEG